jgi:MFS family permease
MRSFLQDHRFILAFTALAVLAGLSVGVAKVTTSLYALDLGATPAQFGLIAGAQSVGVLLMGIPMGLLVDRVGPLRLFAVGSVLAALVYAAVPLVRDAWFLALCTALVSFCMPCRFVSLNTVFLHRLEELGPAKAGWFRGTHTIGFFLLGPAVAAAIVGALSFAGTYWLVAVSFILAIALAPLVLADYVRAEARPFNLAEVGRRLRLVVDDRDLARTCVVELTAQAALMYFTFFIVALAITRFGFAPAEAAALVSAQGLTFIVALFVLGGVAARLGPARAYLVSFIIVIAALASLGLANRGAHLWLGALLLGLGLGLLVTVNFARFASLSARHGRGQIAGLLALVGPTGGLTGSLLGGAIGQRFGIQAMFLLLAPVFAGFAITAWRKRTALVPLRA